MKETVGPGRESSHRDTPAVEEVSKSGPTGAVDPGGGDRPSPAILHETASQRGVRNLGRAKPGDHPLFSHSEPGPEPPFLSIRTAHLSEHDSGNPGKGAGLDRHRPLPPQHGAGSLRPGSGQLALSGKKLLDPLPQGGAKPPLGLLHRKGKGCPGDVPDHRRPLKKESARNRLFPGKAFSRTGNRRIEDQMEQTPVSSLHTDKYQINMMYAHWKNGTHRRRRAFDLYFRQLPFGNGYVVFAGLERAVQYLENLRFTEEDIEYLAGQPEKYDPEFLNMLRSVRFTGDLYAVPEGTLVFPNEPLLRLEGSIMVLQLVETALLNFVGFQSLVATKAARIPHVAPDDVLMEFGSRRAQETEAAVWGARADRK